MSSSTNPNATDVLPLSFDTNASSVDPAAPFDDEPLLCIPPTAEEIRESSETFHESYGLLEAAWRSLMAANSPNARYTATGRFLQILVRILPSCFFSFADRHHSSTPSVALSLTFRAFQKPTGF